MYNPYMPLGFQYMNNYFAYQQMMQEFQQFLMFKRFFSSRPPLSYMPFPHRFHSHLMQNAQEYVDDRAAPYRELYDDDAQQYNRGQQYNPRDRQQQYTHNDRGQQYNPRDRQQQYNQNDDILYDNQLAQQDDLQNIQRDGRELEKRVKNHYNEFLYYKKQLDKKLQAIQNAQPGEDTADLEADISELTKKQGKARKNLEGSFNDKITNLHEHYTILMNEYNDLEERESRGETVDLDKMDALAKQLANIGKQISTTTENKKNINNYIFEVGEEQKDTLSGLVLKNKQDIATLFTLFGEYNDRIKSKEKLEDALARNEISPEQYENDIAALNNAYQQKMQAIKQQGEQIFDLQNEMNKRDKKLARLQNQQNQNINKLRNDVGGYLDTEKEKNKQIMNQKDAQINALNARCDHLQELLEQLVESINRGKNVEGRLNDPKFLGSGENPQFSVGKSQPTSEIPQFPARNPQSASGNPHLLSDPYSLSGSPEIPDTKFNSFASSANPNPPKKSKLNPLAQIKKEEVIQQNGLTPSIKIPKETIVLGSPGDNPNQKPDSLNPLAQIKKEKEPDAFAGIPKPFTFSDGSDDEYEELDSSNLVLKKIEKKEYSFGKDAFSPESSEAPITPIISMSKSELLNQDKHRLQSKSQIDLSLETGIPQPLESNESHHKKNKKKYRHRLHLESKVLSEDETIESNLKLPPQPSFSFNPLSESAEDKIPQHKKKKYRHRLPESSEPQTPISNLRLQNSKLPQPPTFSPLSAPFNPPSSSSVSPNPQPLVTTSNPASLVVGSPALEENSQSNIKYVKISKKPNPNLASPEEVSSTSKLKQENILVLKKQNNSAKADVQLVFGENHSEKAYPAYQLDEHTQIDYDRDIIYDYSEDGKNKILIPIIKSKSTDNYQAIPAIGDRILVMSGYFNQDPYLLIKGENGYELSEDKTLIHNKSYYVELARLPINRITAFSSRVKLSKRKSRANIYNIDKGRQLIYPVYTGRC